jgi:hypothetical protein
MAMLVGIEWCSLRARAVMYGLTSSAGPLMDLNRAGVLVIAANATLESSK